MIGFRRKGIEEFLEITLHTRHGLLRRSSMANRATLSLRDISWMTTPEKLEAKHFAWCCRSWAFVFELHVHKRISRVFVRYFIDCVAYSSISTSNFFDLTWYRSQTEQLCETLGRTFSRNFPRNDLFLKVKLKAGSAFYFKISGTQARQRVKSLSFPHFFFFANRLAALKISKLIL